MKKGTSTQLLVTAAVAGLLGSSVTLIQSASAYAKGKVKCEGGNACSGKSACKTASNDCSGKNGCAGKGWVWTKTKAECDKMKAGAHHEEKKGDEKKEETKS